MWPKVSASLIKKAFFVYTVKIMQVRAFKRYIPLGLPTNADGTKLLIRAVVDNIFITEAYAFLL